MRKTTFANGEFYHIYNRGVDKREVFLDEQDYERFLICLREFNCQEAIGSLYEKSFKKVGDLVPKCEPLIEIVVYCLNPNHFHLILKQFSEKGISKFMLKVSTGYTTYFNKKYKRSGSLFQGPFKAIHVDSNEYLLYLSAYVNRNHFIHNLGTKSPSESLQGEWKYCSALDYLGKRKGTLCKRDEILGQFRSSQKYEEFLDANAEHLKEKKELEKYLLEE